MRKKNVVFTWILCGALLSGAIAMILIQKAVSVIGAAAVLSYGEGQEMRLSLSLDKTYDVESNGYTIHICVKDGQAAFVDSPCPDHLCEQFGWLQETGDIAVCLPAVAMLTIDAE